MAVEGCRKDWRVSEDNGVLGGHKGMLKTLASGWRAGESFIVEWLYMKCCSGKVVEMSFDVARLRYPYAACINPSYLYSATPCFGQYQPRPFIHELDLDFLYLSEKIYLRFLCRCLGTSRPLLYGTFRVSFLRLAGQLF